MPLLFSYGTLQQPEIQISLFGRLLDGWPDELVGFERLPIYLEGAKHSIVRLNGRSDSRVGGTVLEVSDSELAKADAYEPAPYKRISAVLASGTEAWVYGAHS